MLDKLINYCLFVNVVVSLATKIYCSHLFVNFMPDSKCCSDISIVSRINNTSS